MPPPPDTHQPDSQQPESARQPHSTHTPASDSGLSLSSSSSGEIMGTPFDLGAQRFEYPFPQAQGSPTDSFLPLSSITPHSHAQLPPWPIHISKSFPLAPPPLGRLKAHPKLRSATAREPPVPPGLVKRRSRLHHQSSSEEPSDRSDVSDDIARAHRSPRMPASLTKLPPRHPLQSDDAPAEIVPMTQSLSLPIAPFGPPSVEDPAGLAVVAGAAEPPRPQAPQREMELDLARDQMHSFAVYCGIVAGQLYRWIFRLLGWFSRA